MHRYKWAKMGKAQKSVNLSPVLNMLIFNNLKNKAKIIKKKLDLYLKMLYFCVYSLIN